MSHPEPASCGCSACGLVGDALALHVDVRQLGDPDLIKASRSVVRLAAARSDVRHGLTDLGSVVAAFRHDAADGLVTDDPMLEGGTP